MDSKELSIEASERELLQIEIASNQERNENGEIEDKLGEELIDKKFGEKWKVLVVDGKNYGTGWNYVSKGTVLKNNQKLQNDYIINYETGEVKKVKDVKRFADIKKIDKDENNFILSYDDGIGVKEGLILNVDASILDGTIMNDYDSVKDVMGENVELLNFNYSETSGIGEGVFYLDGVDDEMLIDLENAMAFHEDGTPYLGKIDDENEEKHLSVRDVIGKLGFSFEFYGRYYKEGTSLDIDGNQINYSLRPLFCFIAGDRSLYGGRTLVQPGRFTWNAGKAEDLYSDYGDGSGNITYFFNEESTAYGENVFIQLSVDCSNTGEINQEAPYTHSFYLNGDYVCGGKYALNPWNNFLVRLEKMKWLSIGHVGFGVMASGYSKLNIYTLRIYDRGLSEEEISKNYISSVLWHEFLENE